MTEDTRPLLMDHLAKHYSSLKLRLTQLLGNGELASDALQDTWLRVQSKSPEDEGPIQSPTGYLVRVAVNIAMDIQRRQSRTLPYDAVSALLEVSDPNPGPAQTAEGRSELDAALKLMGRMPPRRREVLLMVRVEGLQQKDVAQRLGAHTNTFPGALAQTDGSYVVSGRQRVANTDIHDAYDSQVTLTSGASLRTYASYNETGYSQFQRTQAQNFGTLRPLLEGDGKWLTLNARIAADSPSNSALVFEGLADFSAGKGGLAGGFALSGPDNTHLIITGGQATWFPDHGGDLYVAAQGNLSAYQWSNYYVQSDNVPAWLWRQGGEGMGQQTAWSVNFGTYVLTQNGISVVGFTGFGALGGGNLTLLAGGDAGRLSPLNLVVDTGASEQANTALVAAIGATGRVTGVRTTADGVVTGGTLVQTGGGDLTVRIGGRLDPARFGETSSAVSAGTFTSLRGDLEISAGAIGVVEPGYGQKDAKDPRGADLWTAGQAYPSPGFTVVPGDGTVNLRARGDLVLGGVGDATMLREDPFSQSNYSRLGTLTSDGRNGIGRSWFSLWTPETEVSLFSLGGNVTPFSKDAINTETLGAEGSTRYLPARITAVAGSGSLYYGDSRDNNLVTFELMPAPQGQLEFLAKQSIYSMRSKYSGFSTVSLSGARAGINDLPNPFKPAWILTGPDSDGSLTNIYIDGNPTGGLGTNTLLDVTLPAFEGALPTLKPRLNYFAFQTGDTPQTLLHEGDAEPMRVYAVDGDIVGMSLGSVTKVAKAAQVRAGRDIVRFDGAIMNANETDVSVIEAGRDVMFANARIAGPGTLEVNTGRNLYQGDAGQLVSVGAIIPGDTRPGAGIAVQVGSTNVDWATLASLYLNPANQADLTPGNPLAEQPGKVAYTYEEELAKWLSERYGFTGTTEETLAHFNTLAAEQQRIFLRTVYYAELREGGREYNDADGPRFGSYLRGRQAIATLFPEKDAEGHAIERSGTYTAFGASGIQTQFGGDIQMLVPAGQIILGVQGIAPPATSGLITQGEGDIELYSQGSILLGLSRIMTTFGGGILAWSGEGDINAGRGSKTTLVYTPPKRAYDQWGNVTLSPQVPSSGAGIATLNPIPEVPPGDIDLIAPLGTIDAGEAGIRVSGNVNLAALHVVNADNIQVQGEATGIPTVAAVNVAALTNASAAASSAATAAQDVMQRERASARQNLPSIFTVRVLGFGNESMEGGEQAPPPKSGLQSGVLRYDTSNLVQLVGNGQHFDQRQLSRLTTEERRLLQQDR